MTIVTLYILGVDTIREFSLPIIIGILAGAYSANMINGYVWAALEELRIAHKSQKKLKAKKGISVFSKRLCQRPSEHHLSGGVICVYAI